jgi:divalent metal cation (Fe/Co/Zn/Cd) transporter
MAFVVFYFFYKRNKNFPLIMIIYLIAELIIEAISYIVFGHLSNDPTLMLQKLAFSLVISIVIILYLKRSERVKQTFIF